MSFSIVIVVIRSFEYGRSLSFSFFRLDLNIVIINLFVTNSLLKTFNIFSYLVTSGVNSRLSRQLRDRFSHLIHHRRFFIANHLSLRSIVARLVFNRKPYN